MRCAACFRRQVYEAERARETSDVDRSARAMTWHISAAVTTIGGTALCFQHSLEYRSDDLRRLAGKWWDKEFAND